MKPEIQCLDLCKQLNCTGQHLAPIQIYAVGAVQEKAQEIKNKYTTASNLAIYKGHFVENYFMFNSRFAIMFTIYQIEEIPSLLQG
jgi:hypothetical protein